jgi:hypothetical protein
MESREISRRGVLAAALLPFAPAPGASAAGSCEYVTFGDLAPPYLTLTQSWNALGLDDRDRVYITWTSTRADGRQDCALFRYTHATRTREFLGTYIDVATAAGNLAAGEEIPKGHTRIVQVGRRMYMASQGFHDFKAEITDLPKYRGAHLFSYDLDTGAFTDVSSRLPGGVVVEHQGIVALNYAPEHGVLVGLTHPLGDIVLFDVARERVAKVVPGIPWALGHMVSREIVVTRTGKVYTYRGAEDPLQRATKNEVWCYDLATGVTRHTGQLLQGGFWNGQAPTRDGNTVFLSTVSGDLYRLDVRSGVFTHLGYFIDKEAYGSADQYRVAYLYGISLTPGEDQLLGVPIIVPTTDSSTAPEATRLTSYSIPRRTFTKRRDFDTAVFTGSNHRDRAGNIYLTAFDWDTHCKLAVLKPPYT